MQKSKLGITGTHWLKTPHIVLAAVWLGPWLNAMPPLSLENGLAALASPEYLNLKELDRSIGGIQVAALLLALWLSVFKPWARRR